MKLTIWFLRRTMPFWWVLVVLIIPIAKVCGTINWSWLWATFPAWLPVFLVCLIPGLAILYVLIYSLYKAIFR